jgi:hypothetical protein
MWTRLLAKLMALTGLYAIVLAGLGMRFSGQTNSRNFSLTLVELGIVTVAFVVIAGIMITRRPKQPGDTLE